MPLCKKCLTEKPETDFDVRRSSSLLKTVCRPCCKKISTDTRKRMRELKDERPPPICGTSYDGRAEALEQLGFSSYRDYLQSELWKEIRRKVYATKGRACFLCGADAQALHHNRYLPCDLLGKRLKYISPVCHECHEQIEFLDGKKVSVSKARSAFRRKRKAHLRSIGNQSA